jgi:predicted enzyme related to lactoylglutathione lyase
MIAGAHFLLYSKDAEADRDFFRDVLDLKSIDVGGGWLIFKLPPSEMWIHPGDGQFVQNHGEFDLLGTVLYFLSDDLNATMASLQSKGIVCSTPMDAEWGIATTVPLPSGGRIGLYQPKHPLALDLP